MVVRAVFFDAGRRLAASGRLRERLELDRLENGFELLFREHVLQALLGDGPHLLLRFVLEDRFSKHPGAAEAEREDFFRIEAFGGVRSNGLAVPARLKIHHVGEECEHGDVLVLQLRGRADRHGNRADEGVEQGAAAAVQRLKFGSGLLPERFIELCGHHGRALKIT